MDEQVIRRVFFQKLTEVTAAVQGFSDAMALDLSRFKSELELDLLKNGQLQKFEYSLELTWKFLKYYLLSQKGIDAQGPKDVVREFAKLNALSVAEVSSLLNAIDDRNRIAHEYKDQIMAQIYPLLAMYSNLLRKAISAVEIPK
jgi:nucleotidyltransferase substrate binding protein (TIGR01987 family)